MLFSYQATVSPRVPLDFNSLPIALRKGKRSYTFHPISSFVSYEHLSLYLSAFTTSISYVVVPKSIQEALSQGVLYRGVKP